jgi:hypothetical protein
VGLVFASLFCPPNLLTFKPANLPTLFSSLATTLFLQTLRAVAADFGARNGDLHFEVARGWLCQVRRIRGTFHKAKAQVGVRKGCGMKTLKFTYWKDGNFYLGFLNDYPDYQTQGLSKEDLVNNLKSLLADLESRELP